MEDELKQFQLLLQGLLAPIRRAHETPLLFEIDSRGITHSAWQAVLSETGKPYAEGSVNPNRVITSLESVLALSLGVDGKQSSIEEATDAEEVKSAAAKWLDCLFQEIRIIDPEAIEIMGLRVDGFDNRTISERLGTGLRLVNRIVKDIQQSRATLPVETEAESC